MNFIRVQVLKCSSPITILLIHIKSIMKSILSTFAKTLFLWVYNISTPKSGKGTSPFTNFLLISSNFCSSKLELITWLWCETQAPIWLPFGAWRKYFKDSVVEIFSNIFPILLDVSKSNPNQKSLLLLDFLLFVLFFYFYNL